MRRSVYRKLSRHLFVGFKHKLPFCSGVPLTSGWQLLMSALFITRCMIPGLFTCVMSSILYCVRWHWVIVLRHRILCPFALRCADVCCVVLCCVVLCFRVLCSVTLKLVVLCYAKLCFPLFQVVLCCTKLCRVTLRCVGLYRVVLCCVVLQCVNHSLTKVCAKWLFSRNSSLFAGLI